MNQLEDTVPVCPECLGDLEYVGIEELQYDGESHPHEVWRCASCMNESGVQMDYHYPKGMLTGASVWR